MVVFHGPLFLWLSCLAASVRTTCQVTYEFATCDLGCRAPQPRVFLVAELLDTTDTYLPHNVVLHRCDSSTGCCESSYKTCAVRYQKSVELMIGVKDLQTKRFSEPRGFHFVNHTECYCRELP